MPFEELDMCLRRWAGVALAIGLLFGSTDVQAALHDAEAARGKEIFKFCVGFHTVSPGGISMGPSLAGLYGRRAGAIKGYRYSKVLRQSGIVWNSTTLDRWLSNPRKIVPNSRMLFPGIRNPRDRAALIVILKSVT